MISVVIVTYNSQDTIKSCLDSVLRDDTSKEVIVADNNSKDDTSKILMSYKDRIIFFQNNSNLGFSKANNMAAKEAKGEYLLFLNPDTRFLEEGTLDGLIKLLSENEHYGLIAPKLVLPNGDIQKTVRNLPTIWKAIEEFWLGKEGAFEFFQPQRGELVEVESVVGACILIKSEVFRMVGGFNEKYFLYFEDLELCKDIRKSGLKIGYVGDILVQHVVGVSGRKSNTEKLSLLSARIYFGTWKFAIIQLIGRVGNKLRKL